jgi:hypothetical protein
MIILWNKKVYIKIKRNLIDAFVTLLNEQRNAEIEAGKVKTKNHKNKALINPFDSSLSNIYNDDNHELLARFVQGVVDLSVNELTVHYLGSTKAKLQEPYEEISKIILQQTK